VRLPAGPSNALALPQIGCVGSDMSLSMETFSSLTASFSAPCMPWKDVAPRPNLIYISNQLKSECSMLGSDEPTEVLPISASVRNSLPRVIGLSVLALRVFLQPAAITSWRRMTVAQPPMTSRGHGNMSPCIKQTCKNRNMTRFR
jgi:hypothetical protein